MRKRISRKVREEAAIICAIAASDTITYVGYRTSMYDVFGDDAHGDAADLARAALWSNKFPPNPSFDESRMFWAEAEALLRTGWEPS